MRILIAGADGQVGRALRRATWFDGAQPVTLGRAQLDITDPTSVAAAFDAARPDLVINAAAYTAVDRAESEPARAHAVNATGPGLLAQACAAHGAALLHISTDYVFDGSGDRPWTETDPTGPLGVYGASKLAGENAVAAALPQHVILRTSWVYDAVGPNFVRTMLRLAGERDELRVVADQFGSPTSAGQIAQTILAIAGRIHAGQPEWGLFHFAGSGVTNWHGFTQAIVDGAGWLQRRPAVTAIPTSAYPTPARRPANSRLDCARIARSYGVHAAAWQEALAAVLAEIEALDAPRNT